MLNKKKKRKERDREKEQINFLTKDFKNLILKKLTKSNNPVWGILCSLKA